MEEGDGGGREAPGLEAFLADEPTRELGDWQWLWTEDREFPIRSHRGLLGRLLVAWKKLLRPLVKPPQNDLWERQRVFNLILLERLRRLEEERLGPRVGVLEGALPERLQDVIRHNDALFARLDQKLDRYRRKTLELASGLGAALALAESAGSLEPLERSRGEQLYFELEARHRGTEEEIGARIARHLPRLAGHGPVLDLGCGRGEALALLAAHGLEARGVDASERMVALCRERGLAAESGDLFEALAAAPPGSLGAVVSFHVVEHLPIESLDRLVRLAWSALRPGGLLLLETPSPLSVVNAARNFWLDPTHRRPVHPGTLELLFRQAGFDPVERVDLSPFPPGERLPEIDLARLPAEQRALADQVNRLRDRLDDLLYGFQDYAMVGER